MTDPTSPRTLKDLFSAPQPMWLFQAKDGRVFGPVPEAMLLKGVVRGTLSENTLAHPVGQPQWRPIVAFPRLARAIERLQARVSGVHASQGSEPVKQPRSGPRLSPPHRPKASGE